MRGTRLPGGRTKAATAATVALLLLLTTLGFGATSSAQSVPQDHYPATFRLRGSTGQEHVHVIYKDGFVGKYIGAPTEWKEYNFSVPTNAESITIFFDNDGLTETGADKNLIVDWLEVNGTRIETESAGVLSKGVFNGVDCDAGYRQSEFLACNGYFEFDLEGITDPEPPPERWVLIGYVAQGTTGNEVLELEINGQVVHERRLRTVTTAYVYLHPIDIPIEQARILFNNDAIDTNGKDRNLRVEEFSIGDSVYDPRDMQTKGTWNGSDCGEGYRNSYWLHCNGWFEIPVGDGLDPGNAFVTVTAQGTTGTEVVNLVSRDGKVAATWSLGTVDKQYRVELPIVEAYDGLFVEFINDGYDPNLGDRNVRVSSITVGRDVYDPRDLLSKGTWNGTDCGEGYRDSNWLHCNGWFGIPGG